MWLQSSTLFAEYFLRNKISLPFLLFSHKKEQTMAISFEKSGSSCFRRGKLNLRQSFKYQTFSGKDRSK